MWHHKPDWGNQHHTNIRNVYFDNIQVGRVSEQRVGHNVGDWDWTGNWTLIVGVDRIENAGRTPTITQSLKELRENCYKLALARPEDLRTMIKLVTKSETVRSLYVEKLIQCAANYVPPNN